MASGFWTLTDDGILQIDQSFKSYQLLRKVRITCNTPPAGTNGSYTGSNTFTHAGHVLVAARNSVAGQPFILIETKRVGDQWTITVGAPTSYSVVEVYVYSFGHVTKARHGINIYTDDGEIAFSSAVPWMTIKEVYTVPATGINVTDLPESDYALVPPAFSSFIRGRPPAWMMVMCVAYRVSKTGFDTLLTLWFERPAGTDPVDAGAIVDGVGILVDVSNTVDMVWS